MSLKQSTGEELSFQNEHIDLSVLKQPGCRVIFTITTKPLATKAARKSATKTVSKEVNIPGFRKGHAPEELVLKQFKPHVEREFRDILSRNAIHEAMKLSGFQPFSSNASLKLIKYEPSGEDSFHISCEFEAYPEVPAVDPKRLEIADIALKEVTQEDIDRRLEDLRLHHSTWEEATNRAAKEEDFVLLDIDILDEPPLALHKDSRFLLRKGRIPEWALRAILGMQVGESREADSEPEEGEQKEGFKSKKCRLTLKKIEEAKRPEIDDALAKKAGVATVSELMSSIEKSLKAEHEKKRRQDLRLAVRGKILSLYAFDIPGERMSKLHQECHEVANQEGGAVRTDEEKDAYAHRLMHQAEENMRLSYLFPKIFRDHKLAFPTDAEVRQRATEHMLMQYMAGNVDMNSEDLKHFSQIAESELVAEKAFDFLLEASKRA